ncbi:UNKNOWN [Stylonychia lemnae]|uniref:Uncharacterized protein n=1 Tax=Stylonychia lemnae TaxID=5949 RepID=A0A078B3L1_STYLE|nr:UNKNOWN [Stylonychia lemnae]|eukprot:CDW89120.1 UNKNOWN [Stylonychia lemnae]
MQGDKKKVGQMTYQEQIRYNYILNEMDYRDNKVSDPKQEKREDELRQYMDYITDIIIAKREVRKRYESFVCRPKDRHLSKIQEEPLTQEQISDSNTKPKNKFENTNQKQLNQFANFSLFRDNKSSTLNLTQTPYQNKTLGATQKSWLAGYQDFETSNIGNQNLKKQNKSQMFNFNERSYMQVEPEIWKNDHKTQIVQKINCIDKIKIDGDIKRSSVNQFFDRKDSQGVQNTQSSEMTFTFDDDSSSNFDKALDEFAATFNDNMHL